MKYQKSFVYLSENCLEQMDQFCRNVLIDCTCSYKEDMFFAIHEAIINAIDEVKHFNRIEKKKLKIEIEITDTFAQAKVSNFTRNAISINRLLANKNINRDVWSSRGRGLIFINELVDELYQETDDFGRFVIVMKKLSK